MDRRTLREWFAYLDSSERELNLNEFMALMLFNSREYSRIMLEMLREIQNSSEHTEAMLGAMDVLAERLASANGLPYAASHEIRVAMDAARDEHRKLAAAARSRDDE